MRFGVREWRKITGYACLGCLTWLGVMGPLFYFFGMTSFEKPVDWMFVTVNRLGLRIPMGGGAVLLQIYLGSCVMLLQAFALAASALCILRLSPPQGRPSRSGVALMALPLALASGVFWAIAICYDIAMTGGSGFQILYLFTHALSRLMNMPLGYQYLALTVILGLPLAWCLTWSIDVVRRQRASGAA